MVQRPGDGQVARLRAGGHVRGVDVVESVESLEEDAIAFAHVEIGVESAGEGERFRPRILRDEFEGQFHGEGDRQFEIEIVRPERARIRVRGDAEGEFRHFLGIFRAAHLEEQDARETVRNHAGDGETAELGPADGNAAMHLVRAIVGVFRRREEDGRVSRGAVGERVGAQEGDFGDAVAVGEHGDGSAFVAGAEDDPAGCAVAG